MPDLLHIPLPVLSVLSQTPTNLAEMSHGDHPRVIIVQMQGILS